MYICEALNLENYLQGLDPKGDSLFDFRRLEAALLAGCCSGKAQGKTGRRRNGDSQIQSQHLENPEV